MTRNNPLERGQFTFKAIIYSAPGLRYTDQGQQQYKIFEVPTPGFETKYIDTSAFASLPQSPSWPFNIYNTPINGLARIPDGDGPFPLVIIAHGNHRPIDNSTPGYLYLCDLLASQGFIAATIDVNFLNGRNSGENDGRAIIHLEHIKQFSEWNSQNGHALQGKVDLNNIMIAGHSRGGEAVGHASYFNKLDSVQPDTFSPVIRLDGSNGLGPYKFNIRAVVAIAPTDGQYVPITGPTVIEDTYFLIHGSRDGDVSQFPGQKTYDRARLSTAIIRHKDRANNNDRGESVGSFKSLLWIHGANHNYFNSAWNQEATVPTISRNQQEQILSVYLSALAQLMLMTRKSYQSLLMNHQYAYDNNWIPRTQKLVSQFYDHASFSIQNNENQSTTPILNPSVSGSVDFSGVALQVLKMNLGSNSHLFQDTRGIRIEWQKPNSSYTVNIEPSSLLADEYTHLSFRIGQSFEGMNQIGVDQDFNIEVSDGSNSTSIKASELSDLIYPDAATARGPAKTVMQSLMIPVSRLRAASIDIEEIKQIKLNFNIRNTGIVYMDDLVLTTEGENHVN